MSSAFEAQLSEELTPVIAQLNLELDALSVTRSGKYRVLEIALDGDQVDLDTISSATKRISEFLDDSNLMGEQQYTLEVTTRGIDRPLAKPAHWQRNVGRLVEIKSDAFSGIGRIKNFLDPVVTIEVKNQTLEINTSQISQAVVQVEFSNPNERG